MDLGRAQWAGSLHASHADRKETKATGLNGSTRAVSLPNFIVIKVPETVPAPHNSVALSLPWFLNVLHPNLPNTLWFCGGSGSLGPVGMCPLRA